MKLNNAYQARVQDIKENLQQNLQTVTDRKKIAKARINIKEAPVGKAIVLANMYNMVRSFLTA